MGQLIWVRNDQPHPNPPQIGEGTVQGSPAIRFAAIRLLPQSGGGWEGVAW